MVKCGGEGLVGGRLIVEGVWLYVVRLHEVAIAHSSLFNVVLPVGFGTWTLVELAEGRVGQCSREGSQVFDVLLH